MGIDSAPILLSDLADLPLDERDHIYQPGTDLLRKHLLPEMADDPQGMIPGNAQLQAFGVQVFASNFKGFKFGVIALGKPVEPIYVNYNDGIPHGIGRISFQTIKQNLTTGQRDKLISSPVEELTRILESESHDPSSSVGAPFTVLLLHLDGTISDESSGPGKGVCKIPTDALYRAPGNVP